MNRKINTVLLIRFLEISLRTSSTLGVGANSFSIETGCRIGRFSHELSFSSGTLTLFLGPDFRIYDKVFPCTLELSASEKLIEQFYLNMESHQYSPLTGLVRIEQKELLRREDFGAIDAKPESERCSAPLSLYLPFPFCVRSESWL